MAIPSDTSSDPSKETDEQQKLATELKGAPLAASAYDDINKSFDVALKLARKELGNNADSAAVEELARDIHYKQYLVPLITEHIRKTQGEAKADALKKLIENIPEGNKAHWAEILKFFNKHGMMDAETLEKYRDNYMSMQKGIIDDAIEAGMAPYKAMQMLSTLGVMVGGIAGMVGQAMGKPEWTAFGEQAITMSMGFAQMAQKGILEQEKLLERLAVAPPKFSDHLAALDAKVVTRMRPYNALQTELNLNPKQAREIMNPFGGSHGAAPGAGGRVSFSPISATDRETVFQAMIHQESRGRQLDARGQPLTSSAGAVGVAQIMPGTGPEAAKLAGVAWDPIRWQKDRDYNMKLGRAYFSKQVDDFGDINLAVMAYNAGPGAVRAALGIGGVSADVRKRISKIGDPRKGEVPMEEFVRRFPYQETRDYVAIISNRVNDPQSVAALAASDAIKNAQNSSRDALARQTQAQYQAAARSGPAPRAADGDRSFDRSAVALTLRGETFENTSQTSVLTGQPIDPRNLPSPALNPPG